MEVQSAGLAGEIFQNVRGRPLPSLVPGFLNQARPVGERVASGAVHSVIDDNRVNMNVGFERDAQQFSPCISAVIVGAVRNNDYRPLDELRMAHAVQTEIQRVNESSES